MPSFFAPSRLLGILPRQKPAVSAPVAQVVADFAKAHALPLRHEGPDLQAQATIATRGLFLARQERWSDLSHEMKMADRHLDRTLGGVAHAPLLARGAAGDAIGPLLQVLADPGLVAAHAPGGGISALEEALEDFEDDFALGLVLVYALIETGLAWRGQGWISDVPQAHWHQFQAHFQQAQAVLAAHGQFTRNSAAYAAARCALFAALPARAEEVCTAYEWLIDLDPGNPHHMRNFGVHLLPRWFGDYDRLETQAERIAGRCASVWGAGGYAWVYLDALRHDPKALTVLNVDRFANAVTAILDNAEIPHYANDLAAFGALTLAGPAFQSGVLRPMAQGLRQALDQVLQGRLREIHAPVWMQAAQPVALPGTAARPVVEEGGKIPPAVPLFQPGLRRRAQISRLRPSLSA